MQTVLITGGGGLVGSRVIELLSSDFKFVAPSSHELDITNSKSTESYLKNHDFDLLLHLAAYTNVDNAETEKELCHLINVTGTQNLWQVTKSLNKQFILISTDFVFNGQGEPFIESSSPNPLGYYGQSKYEAEQLVKDQVMIIRPSYPYRASFPRKKDFVRGILSVLEQGKIIQGITDSVITPTFIDDIALNLKTLINNFKPEIYHLVGANSMSPYEAFQLIAQTFDQNPELIQPISFKSYFANKAPRPQFSKIVNTREWLHFHTFSEGLNLVKQSLA